MKIKRIFEPIFNTHLLFIYDCDFIEAENYLQKNDIRADLIKCTAQTGAYTHIDKDKSRQQRYYIFVRKTDKGWIIELSTIIHEISHLVFMALHDCGIEINQKTDEIYSYYFEWWFREILKTVGSDKKLFKNEN